MDSMNPSYRLLARAVELPPKLLGHGEHLFLGRGGALGLSFVVVAFWCCEGERR